MSSVFVVCDECEGFGFEIVMDSPWEESLDSPAECRTCIGMGLIPVDLGDEGSVVHNRCHTRSNDACVCRGQSSNPYDDWDNRDCA